MACDVGYVYLSNAVSVITDEYPFIAETDGDISPLKGAWEDWTVPDKPTDPSLATVKYIARPQLNIDRPLNVDLVVDLELRCPRAAKPYYPTI